ncbi:hypothetical protein PINS_up007202 [Pythium insidiosum]|nr:hypothetical protein PINS_up007202 [Pythium insidiosum]
MIMVLFLRVKTKEYSVDIRRLVWRKRQQKMAYKQIAEEVMIPFTAVKGILSRMKKNGGCAQTAPRSGRPKTTTKRLDSIIVRQALSNRRTSAAALKQMVADDYKITSSESTIRNRLDKQIFTVVQRAKDRS